MDDVDELIGYEISCEGVSGRDAATIRTLRTVFLNSVEWSAAKSTSHNDSLKLHAVGIVAALRQPARKRFAPQNEKGPAMKELACFKLLQADPFLP